MLAFENDPRVKFIDSADGTILPGMTEARALCLKRKHEGGKGSRFAPEQIRRLYKADDSKEPCDSKSAVDKWAPHAGGDKA